MEFRTVVHPIKTQLRISHSDRILMLGSCFTDNIGEQLEMDGFDVCHNPLGPLYNPASVAITLDHALADRTYNHNDLVTDSDGRYHCLFYASRYSHNDANELLSKLNADFAVLKQHLANASVIIITFGTTRYFRHHGMDHIVGNCHKFPANDFDDKYLTIDQIVELWQPILAKLPHGVPIIFTVSPIRHTGHSMHDNQISKSTLHLAIEELSKLHNATSYFPAYEIMIDDLRDYRFYAEDMKHPSPVAIKYIYDIFSQSYFSEDTKQRCHDSRRIAIRAAHRNIIEL